MKKILMSLMMLSALLGFVPTGQAASLEFGPFCFSTAPFVDIFVWFLNTDGGNQVIGSGQDLAGDRSQTVSGFIRSGILHVGYTTHPQPGFVPVIAGGTIDLATGTGLGQCFSPDLVSCGDFTFTRVACPDLGTTITTMDLSIGSLGRGSVQGAVR